MAQIITTGNEPLPFLYPLLYGLLQNSHKMIHDYKFSGLCHWKGNEIFLSGIIVSFN